MTSRGCWIRPRSTAGSEVVRPGARWPRVGHERRPQAASLKPRSSIFFQRSESRTEFSWSTIFIRGLEPSTGGTLRYGRAFPDGANDALNANRAAGGYRTNNQESDVASGT